jgi:hypothetical protein
MFMYGGCNTKPSATANNSNLKKKAAYPSSAKAPSNHFKQKPPIKHFKQHQTTFKPSQTT